MLLSIRSGDAVLYRFGNALASMGERKANIVYMRALNAEGDKAKTRVIRALTPQTGLKRKVIVRAVRRRGASVSDLSYALKTKGGNIRLKYFGPREFKFGVRAKPRSKPTRYPGAFTRGGAWGSRVPFSVKGMAGNVFKRTGEDRKIRMLRSDVYIPEELTRGETKAAWGITLPALATQVGRQIGAVFRGF